MPSSSLPTDLSPTVDASLEMQSQFRDFFGWRESEDHDSARALLASVEDSAIPSWEGHNRLVALSKLYRRMVIRKTEIAVLGAAVEPEELIQVLVNPVLFVSADGATGVLSELPSSTSEKAWSRLACVVSDADGGSGTIEAVKRAIPIVLHAHGDNREDWEGLLEQAKSQAEPPDLILTHQTPRDIPGMHNPGGFTDGDRAVCFLLALGVERDRISLLGTRTDIVGRWSGNTDEERKMEKLTWMSRVLHMHGF
ncbi:MAG: hypothetical protein VX492_05530 [Candidatus Thermoplasmatota archaeon]|nr:hypothetical protein [Candidatus Thermoplasmatota archaeon]